MSVAVTWPLRTILAAGCVLTLCMLPQSSTGQMPPIPQPMMSNPNDLNSSDRREESTSSDKKLSKEERQHAKETAKAAGSPVSPTENVSTSSAPSPAPALYGQQAAPTVVPFTAISAGPARKLCGKKPKPIIVGSNGKVGSGARAKGKALSTLGGLAGGFLGGGGGGGGKGKDGPPLVKCKIKDKEMTVFTDPGTGISLKVGAKQAGDTVNVFAEVAKSPDNGTFQTAYMSQPGEDPQVPRDVGICGLWGEWSLTVSWTKTTYVNGQKVSEERGGYSKAGNFNIPGTVSSDAAPAGLWKQMGFSNASHGARGIAMQYKTPAALAAGQPVGMVIHVTRPGEDPVTTVPFNLLMTRTPNGFQFQQAPDEECPEEPAGPLVAGNDNDGASGGGLASVPGGGPSVAPGPSTTSGPACRPGGTCVASKDPCEEHLRRARELLESRPKSDDGSVDGLRDRAAQEASIANGLASEANVTRYDHEQAARRAEDARGEADFRKGLYEKFGTHQRGQTASYGELADSARQMGDGMEARAADAEQRAGKWDEAADRYDKLAETTDDPSLADAARQAAANAREDAAKLRKQAEEYREQAREDYERAEDRQQSGEQIQEDTEKLAKDAEDAERAAEEARMLAECLKRVAAQLETMAAEQAEAAQLAADRLTQAERDRAAAELAATGPKTSTPPPVSTGGIAAVDGGSGCPWPTGRISVHMVDAEVYTPFLYGSSDTYTDLADIVRQLRAKVAPHYDPRGLCGRCIEQLDVWGHGDTAGGYISFGPNDAQIGDMPLGNNFDQNLSALGGLMCVGGKIVINQCKAGTGKKGTEALKALADKVGVPVSGPTDKIKGCRIFGGALTDYKEEAPGPTAKTPDQNQAGPVSPPP